jgi:hypothetical protein
VSDNKEPFISDEQALETGTQALFTAIGEGARLAVPAVAASAGWQAMLAVALPLMGLAVAKGAQRLFAPRTALLAKGYGKAFDNDPKKVEDHAKQHEHDADYHETMFRTFRAMIDAAEPEVVEALGYMAGVYTSAGRKADALFRSVGRLLCDLEAGELAVVRKLLREVEKHDHGDEPMGFRGLHLSIGTVNERDTRILTVGNAAFHIDEMPQAPRLFMLLKREGLGSSQPLPREVEHLNRNIPPSGDRTMRILGATAANVLRLIDPQ